MSDYLIRRNELLQKKVVSQREEIELLRSQIDRLNEYALWNKDGELPMESVTVEIDYDPFFGNHEYGHAFVENGKWFLVEHQKRTELKNKVHRWRRVPGLLFSDDMEVTK
jgi:hypothetical protein